MARKNLLEGLADLPADNAPASYPMRGAGRSMVRSLDDLARQADKFLEGETIVELDPEFIDSSFVRDRLSHDDQEFRDLVETIKSRGQDTPILVRPHASLPDRYQVVFGHRRLRAAAELGRKVLAVVKPIDDRTHVIAQGQENSARANLSFIEKALFAKRIEELGYDRDVISASLVANAASVSKMISVTERIPSSVIEKIGSAPGTGRERWVSLSLLVGKAANSSKVSEILQSSDFEPLASDERFAAVHKALSSSTRAVKKSIASPRQSTWHPRDKAVVADIKNTGKRFSLSMKAKNAGRFGEYLSGQLDALYAQFLAFEQSEGE